MWALPFPKARKDCFGKQLCLSFNELPTIDMVVLGFRNHGVELKSEEIKRIKSTLRAMRKVEINYYVDSE